MVDGSKNLITRVRFGAPLAWVRRSLVYHVILFSKLNIYIYVILFNVYFGFYLDPCRRRFLS